MQNFQAVVSTDGSATFVAFIYDDPQGIVGLINTSTSQEDFIIGFDPGEDGDDEFPSADFSGAVREGRLILEPVNIFRIDGWFCTQLEKRRILVVGREDLRYIQYITLSIRLGYKTLQGVWLLALIGDSTECIKFQVSASPELVPMRCGTWRVLPQSAMKIS